jgi:hypothetical protein
VTIILGVVTLLLLLVVAVWLIFSARDLESRINVLLRDQVDLIHAAEQSLERLRLQSNRTL